MTKRLFLAIDPPASLSSRLAGLDPTIPGLRWMEPGNHHLTLRFLGNVGPEARENLVRKLEEVRLPAFGISLSTLGTFGGHRGKPWVVWAGATDGSGALAALHDRIVEAIRAAGIDPGSGRFRPHVTLGRGKRADGRAVRDFVHAHADETFGDMTATGFTLYSSRLLPEGAEYHAEARFPLGEA